ncbi:universal stress protein [Crenobacter intestini]|uniref:Universal stress protein n=1 Tax=Crenobacter intestini TaxID=2563443 RepID=A0A4T0V2C3_9NEIS|nr:universal stress protein [Crenobacter intestini]TIC85305.1 universal stress protein [Crenobacter intestini]
MPGRVLLLLQAHPSSFDARAQARGQALAFARARAAGLDVVVLLDASSRLSGAEASVTALFTHQEEDDAWRHAHALSAAVAQEAQAAGLAFTARDVETAHPLELLSAAEAACDMVVLERGAATLRFLPHYLEDASRPCLLAGRQGTGPVLIAYDGGGASARALQQVLWLGLGSAGVTLLSLGADAEADVGVAARYLASHALAAQCVTRPLGGHPAAQIEAEAQALDPSLLVLGVRGRHGWRRALTGSTCQRLLHGDRALLLVP